MGCGSAGEETPPTGETSGQKPNFVFFLVDDMGWTDAGYQGSRLYETPNIDRLAREGVRFSNAYASSPYCSPSRASIQTGKYPVRTGINCWIGYTPRLNRKWIGPPNQGHLDLEEVTLAEAFREAGYATGYIGKWHLGAGEYYPEHQGYDVALASTGGQAGRYFYPFAPEIMKDLEEAQWGDFLTDRLVDETIRFISRHAGQDRPFLVFTSTYAMHSDIDARDDLVEKYRRKLAELPPGAPPRYVQEGEPAHASGMGVARWQENPVFAAMLESLDENVGRILDHLEKLEIADNTVVLFFSDNGGQATLGTATLRHDVPRTVHDTANAPLRGGKGYLFEGGIREPLIIKWPGVTTAGQGCDVPVVNTDFYPTMLEMAGIPLLPEQHRDGVSLAPLLRNGEAPDREAIFWHMPNYGTNGDFPGSAIRCGDYKLIHFFEDDSMALYNLAEDIGEQNDLSEQMSDKTAEMLRMLQEWRQAVDAPGMEPNPFWDG